MQARSRPWRSRPWLGATTSCSVMRTAKRMSACRCRPCSRSGTATPSSCSATCRINRGCCATSGASAVPVVALWQARALCDSPTIRCGRSGRAWRAGVERLAKLGHRRIGFVSGQLPGENTKREDDYVEAMHDRFGPIPDGWVKRLRTASKGASLRCTCCSRCPKPDGGGDGRRTLSPWVRSTRHTRSAASSRSNCPLWASTTSSLPPTRSLRSRRCTCGSRRSSRLELGWRSTSRATAPVAGACGHGLRAAARRPPVERSARGRLSDTRPGQRSSWGLAARENSLRRPLAGHRGHLVRTSFRMPVLHARA